MFTLEGLLMGFEVHLVTMTKMRDLVIDNIRIGEAFSNQQMPDAMVITLIIKECIGVMNYDVIEIDECQKYTTGYFCKVKVFALTNRVLGYKACLLYTSPSPRDRG